MIKCEICGQSVYFHTDYTDKVPDAGACEKSASSIWASAVLESEKRGRSAGYDAGHSVGLRHASMCVVGILPSNSDMEKDKKVALATLPPVKGPSNGNS